MIFLSLASGGETQQPAGMRKICILVCKLLGVKILCCVPRVMPDMWKRSITCENNVHLLAAANNLRIASRAHLQCFRHLLMVPAIKMFMRVQQRRATSQLRKHAIGIDLQPNGELVLTRS